MTGWLIGHPQYCKMWAAAGLWNGVLDMNAMLASTDIPDWIFACSKNTDFTKFGQISAEDCALLHSKSPISQISNVQTPSLFLIGDSDKRVPPHQSYFYFNVLKSMGIDCKLYDYPGSGHSLL